MNYSNIVSCLYDQPIPVGNLGRGAHYSIFRSTQFRDTDGRRTEEASLHDFAVIWDEDHDTRIIDLVEELHLSGLLWPVMFIGERKGGVTVVMDDRLRRAGNIGSDYLNRVVQICDRQPDPWGCDFGIFDVFFEREVSTTNPSSLIQATKDEVVPYLQSINMLWKLGLKRP